MMDEKIRSCMAEMAKTLDIVNQVFDSKNIEPVKVSLAQLVKVLQTNQVKTNRERSRIIRLLPWLRTIWNRPRKEEPK